jgi:HEAT repeat protein
VGQRQQPLRVLFLLLTVGCGVVAAPLPPETKGPPPEEESLFSRADAFVAPVLVSLLDEHKLKRPSRDDLKETALNDIKRLNTPAGYRLRTRFQELGVVLAQGLALSQDDRLQRRLLEAARWTSSPYTRSEALVGLATLQNPSHLKYFREALLDQDPNIQFAAVDALRIWNRRETIPYLLDTAARSWSPLIRVYAAQVALRLGEPQGRENLLAMVRDNNSLVRAMAARYLGELGEPQDADRLLSRIHSEGDSPFVLAEICIGALKLLGKREPVPEVPLETFPSRPAPRRGEAFELEPLMVTAPRLKLPRHLVDVRIDASLVQLLEKMVEEPPLERIILEELRNLKTPVGFALGIRYTDLSVLLIEGLAGTDNFSLIQHLETIARKNPSSSLRATALVALGYDSTRQDLFVFQEAIRDPKLFVRFGAVEGLAALGTSQTRSLLADVAQGDESRALRVFAAAALSQTGDHYGRQLLLQSLNDFDWPIRAMATYYLGQWGKPEDYYVIQSLLNREDNDFVRAEWCLAQGSSTQGGS